jgi:simple sugar transport system ATP-binding protein
MKADGKAIIIITHKLHEVLAISDRVTTLRKGQYVGTVDTAGATAQSLTEGMVGRAVSLQIAREAQPETPDRLVVEHLSCLGPDGVRALDDIGFTLRGGEILGVAGIAGSGQKELCEALMGMHPVASGTVLYCEGLKREDITHYDNTQRWRKGIKGAFVPEDRLGMGLVANLDMVDNVMLKSYRNTRGFFADRRTPKKLADELIRQLEIVTPDTSTPVRRLSGGNVQKVLLGREIASNPTVLVVAYPVRGLDINSSYTVYDLLNEQKRKGVGVLFVGEDLDVLLELCDRIMVLCGGRLSGIVDGPTASKNEVGYLMTHVGEGPGREVV